MRLEAASGAAPFRIWRALECALAVSDEERRLGHFDHRRRLRELDVPARAPSPTPLLESRPERSRSRRLRLCNRRAIGARCRLLMAAANSHGGRVTLRLTETEHDRVYVRGRAGDGLPSRWPGERQVDSSAATARSRWTGECRARAGVARRFRPVDAPHCVALCENRHAMAAPREPVARRARGERIDAHGERGTVRALERRAERQMGASPSRAGRGVRAARNGNARRSVAHRWNDGTRRGLRLRRDVARSSATRGRERSRRRRGHLRADARACDGTRRRGATDQRQVRARRTHKPTRSNGKNTSVRSCRGSG